MSGGNSTGKPPGRKPRGRHPSKKLNPKELRSLPPGRHADGEGLHLVVRTSGELYDAGAVSSRGRGLRSCAESVSNGDSTQRDHPESRSLCDRLLSPVRYWVQRLVIKGKRRDLGLGSLEYVSLAEARAKAYDNRRIAREGGDPTFAPKPEKGPIFRVVYESVKKIRAANWKGKEPPAAWGRDFEEYVLPSIGKLPVEEITVQQLVHVILPHWKGRGSKGYLMRQNLAAIFRYAVVSKYRADNPAADLAAILPNVRREVKHQASLSYAQAPEMLTEWQTLPVEPIYKWLLIFIVVTASRFGQAAKATWSEFDLSERTWSVPANHMKAAKTHDVPIPNQLVELLKALEPWKTGDDSLVFPRPRSTGASEVIEPSLLLTRLRKLKKSSVDGRPIATHGFRSTFRVWTIEQARASREVCEAALAHSESDKTVAAYTDDANTFEDRVELMQAWADFLLGKDWRPGE